jgi:hypothetical protein
MKWAMERAALGLAMVLLVACSGKSGTKDETDIQWKADLPETATQDVGVDTGELDLGGGGDQLIFDVKPGDTVGTCAEPPYGFGCPCSGNGDCVSGFCVESTYGGVCTEPCLEECPDGWKCKGVPNFGADLVFICVPATKKLCYPCQKDDQCGGGKCVEIGGEMFCAAFCDTDNPCPDGFACVGGEEESLCKPTSGFCDCLPQTAGSVKSCNETNEFGTCYGFAECDPALGWTACTAATPEPEKCDGKDNDCNGMLDEKLPEEPCVIENEFGSCSGMASCLGPLGYVCQAPEPAAESCDYVDNDCDGQVDEDFLNAQGKYNQFEHCGSCSVTCAVGFPNATAMCDATKAVPKCIVDSCDPGYFKLNDYQCIPNTASLCEPCTTDDNCLFEGAKCVTLSDGQFCSKSCGEGDACPDGYECTDYDGTLQCIPVTNSCTCTGDNLDLSKSCTATWPVQPEPGEPSITCYGFQFCLADGWSDCDLPDEACDGQDNDCNGIADDPYVDDQGRYVTDENCGQCGNNCKALNLPNADGVCNTGKAIPDCTMACKDGFYDVNANPADGCECLFQSDLDLPDGADQNCDGVDGELDNAVFVAKNGNDGAAGTVDAPMLTINAAVDKALASGKRDVYVATGVYALSVVLKEGVSLYGGYSSDFKTRHVLLYETVVMGEVPSLLKPGAVNASGIKQETTILDGFTIFGWDNDEPGASSYTLYVRDCSDKLTVRNCHIYAGDGGNGSMGGNGQDGQDGIDGSNGAKAYLYNNASCTGGQKSAGGGGAVKSCGGTSVSGGSGGGSYCPSFSVAPAAGEKGSNGSGPGAGSGGTAGYDAIFQSSCNTCSVPTETSPMDGANGQHGQDGNHGSAGNGCSQTGGGVSGGLWQPNGGGNGATASHGGGGGSGGGGGGADVSPSVWGCNEQIGGTGGGGGSGGCSGSGGSGGGGGGGSFGLFLYYSSNPASVPVIEENTFLGGKGGSGGLGGNGGTGGVGGAGGGGGTEDTGAWCARGGGNGGNGGDGGHGGGGGGGCGGVSYCLYAHGYGNVNMNAIKNGNDFAAGIGGTGGSGGPSIGNPGQSGSSGPAQATNF